jgi:amino acid adenylation domain-containing protein
MKAQKKTPEYFERTHFYGGFMIRLFEIPDKVSRTIHYFSESDSFSHELIWRTAFQAYLYRTTHQPRIVVASWDTNRDDPLAYLLDFDQNATFREQLSGVRSIPMGEFPIQAAFHFGQDDVSESVASNISLRVNGNLNWSFSADHYSNVEIDRMSANFLVFLENLVTDFGQVCARIPILTQEQWITQADVWNRTEMHFDADLTLHQIFEMQVKSNPDAPAVYFNGQSLTYRELNIRSNQMAHSLLENGLIPGALVGLYFERGTDLIVTMLSVLKAGGVFVPLDPKYPADALNYILKNVNLSFLITRSTLAGQFPRGIKYTPIYYDKLDFASHVSDFSPPACVSPEALAFVLFTSGSTGTPKGVMHTHRNILARFTATQEIIRMGGGDMFSQSSPVSSIDAIDELFLPLMYGAATAVISYEQVVDPRLFLEELHSREITHILLVPSLLRVILDNLGDHPGRLKKMKVCIVGGEALPGRLAETFLQKLPTARLYNYYGLTEGDVSAVEITAENIQKPSIGRPVSNTKVYLLDEFNNLVPPGIPGEICISSEGLFAGYLNQPDLNEKVFFPNPFLHSVQNSYARLFRTGDFACYFPDGTLEYIGRRDRMIKVRGFRVELDAVENVLRRHPGVQECLVTTKASQAIDANSPSKQKKIVAYFLPREGIGISVREIQNYLTGHLPDYSVPQSVIQVDQFPLSPNGKIDIKALPNPTEVSRQSHEALVTPRNPVETKLAAIWENLLQVKPIGVDENFFDLGGDSLSAIDLVLSMEKAFNRSLPISILLQHPTIADLSKVLISDAAPLHLPSLVPIKPQGTLPPLFCIHADGGVMFYYRFAHQMSKEQPIYGLQARGLSAGDHPHASVPQIATDYIKEIKTVQPQGPYRFCAFSLGGVIALEMTRQLRAAGEEVDFVGLLDAYAPGYPQLLSKKSLAQYKTSVHMSTLRMQDWRGKLHYLRRRLETRTDKILTTIFGSFFVSFGIPLPQKIRYYYVANILNEMVDKHQPRVCPGSITLFRASVQPENTVPDPWLGWKKYVSGDINIVEITGTHNSIVKDPHLSNLIQAIENEFLRIS